MNIITNDAGSVFTAKDRVPAGTKVVLFYDPSEKVLTIPEAMQLASMKNLVLYDNGNRPFGGYEIGRFVGRDEKSKYVIVGEGLQITEDENVKVAAGFEEAIKICQASVQVPKAKAPRKKKAKAPEDAPAPSEAGPAEEKAPVKKTDRKKKEGEDPEKEPAAPLEAFMPEPETGEKNEEEKLSVFNELPTPEGEGPEDLGSIRDTLYEKLKEVGKETYENREYVVSTLQQTLHPISLQMTLGMNLHNGELAKTISEQIGGRFKELKGMAEKLPPMRLTKN